MKNPSKGNAHPNIDKTASNQTIQYNQPTSNKLNKTQVPPKAVENF